MAWPAVLQDVGFRNMTARKSVNYKVENKVRNTELSCLPWYHRCWCCYTHSNIRT